MSDPRNLIAALFGVAPPAAEQVLEERKRLDDLCKTAMPVVRDIREKLRDLIRIGVSNPHVTVAREQMALLEDQLEAALAQPLELPKSPPKRQAPADDVADGDGT